jgi:hypothetical protein
MSLIAPPDRQQFFPPRPPLRARLVHEWRHWWVQMPPHTFALLLLPTVLLLAIDPLLPFAAAVLWYWASHSWVWRDCWVSIRVWAKQGSMLVACFITLAMLDVAHLWIVSQLIAILQSCWEQHLPGMLSLSPLALQALPSRSLLLLPLAPALALYYERLDPRTCVQPQRILTPKDLAEPEAAREAKAEPAPTAKKPPAARAKIRAQPASKGAPPKRRSRRQASQPITIESFLASGQAAQQAPSPPAPPSPSSPDVPAGPPPQKRINWDDVVS